MAWWSNSRSADRAGLTAGALELAELGWPVLPGTFWQTTGWTGCADAPQNGPVPLLRSGLAGATCDRRTVTRWWSERPYSLLVATGATVDAIEVSASVGRRVSEQLRASGLNAPVGVGPNGRWWFAVGPGEALRPELASRADVALHGRGSWVVAPPTGFAEGVTQWKVAPTTAGLPDTYEVQIAVLDVLGERPVLAAASVGSGAVGTGVNSWT
jgi:hypothetical protein